MRQFYFIAIVFASFLTLSTSINLSAQQSDGGLPWSITKNEKINNGSIINLSRPDFENAIKEDANPENATGMFRFGLPTLCDISLNDGTFTYLNDGSIIWRAIVSVSDAKALTIYYDKFSLPAGVNYYVINGSGKQVLGAYNSKNNNEYENFVTNLTQGNVAYLELNIEKGVALENIVFHIDHLIVAYRGVDELNKQYASFDSPTKAKPTDESSSCEINSLCPQGVNYEKQRRSTVRISIQGGACTGTLINNTGNNQNNTCKPYVLTASHCDGDNSYEDAHYSQWIFNFNYEYPNCEGTGFADITQSMIGANFKARSHYLSFPSVNDNLPLVSDFLLLELKNSIPSNFNSYLCGWNRNPGLANNDNYDFFIGFHHPKGDPKKLSVYNTGNILGGGTFNQTQVLGTHWEVNYNVGGTEKGSSGSGLFDKDGLLIGDLSGGADNTSGPCAPMGTNALYSKLSYGWENEFDQSHFSEFAGSKSQLKGWLDPANTGQITLGTVKSDCSDAPSVGVDELKSILNNSINIYPIPSNGNVNIQFNFKESVDISCFIYDISGRKIKSYSFSRIKSAVETLNLQDLPNGTYYLQFDNSNVSVGKKIIIAK